MQDMNGRTTRGFKKTSPTGLVTFTKFNGQPVELHADDVRDTREGMAKDDKATTRIIFDTESGEGVTVLGAPMEVRAKLGLA